MNFLKTYSAEIIISSVCLVLETLVIKSILSVTWPAAIILAILFGASVCVMIKFIGDLG